MKIAVIGTGYVGLVAGACFSKLGFKVTCIDKDKDKIEKLRLGKIHIYEPGLEEIVVKGLSNNSLSFTTDLAVLDSHEILIIAVGTPSTVDGDADLSALHVAVEDIITHTTSGKIVMIKSTVPIGTARMIKSKFLEAKPGTGYEVISNPEFLREGEAVRDFLEPDRIIIGCQPSGEEIIRKLYFPITSKDIPIFFTSNTSAEMIKYTANSYLAMRIAFINEIADLSEKMGGNIDDIAQGIGFDQRIGGHYLHPGPGYGGSCFPKDTLALAKCARDCADPLTIVETVIKSNNDRQVKMAEKVRKIIGEVKQGEFISLLGLTFKADTDDLRDSPSIRIIELLDSYGYTCKVYDPSSPKTAAKVLPNKAIICQNIKECISGGKAAIILTEWNEFKLIHPSQFKELLATPVVIDLRNIYKPELMQKQGLEYYSIGR
jgi:UDPglucose 6-dehydrogenase